MIFDLQDPALTRAAIECPADETISVAAAAQARRSARFAEAVQIAACVLQAHPEDADAWFELGAARFALGDRAKAKEAWLRTLDLAPRNDDARLGLARAAWADGDVAGARRWLADVSGARSNDPEVAALRARLDQANDQPRAFRLDASAARSSLSGGLPDWSEARVSIFHRAGGLGLGLAIEQARRFETDDTYVEAQATYQLGAIVWSLAAGTTPRANFRPERSIRIGGDYYAADYEIGAALTHADYVAGPVEKADLRLTRSFGPVRLQVSGVAVHDENGKSRYGYGLGALWEPTSAITFTAGWSDAPESSDGMTVDVRAASLAGSVAVMPDLKIRAGVTHEMREAYDRTEISVGLARTF